MNTKKSFSFSLLYFFLLTINGFVYAHSGTHSQEHAHLWRLMEDNRSFKADYIAFENGIVLLQNLSSGMISQYPITDFSIEDQLLILKRHELTAHINANLAKPMLRLKTKAPVLKISKFNANIGVVLLLLTLLSFTLYFSRSNKKNFLFPSLLSITFLFFITCSTEDATPLETDNTPTVDPVIRFTLTITSGVGGTVSSPGGSYTQGNSVSITATPNSEYVFVNWSNGSTDNPLSVTVDSNQTITANFEKRKYPLTVSITGSGTVSEEIISSGKSTTEYTSGSVIRLTANPLDEWVFTGWSGSVSSTDNPIELTVNESKTISVTFIPAVSETPTNTTTNTTSNTSTNTSTTPDPSSLLSTIESHFSAFTDVSITADDEYFYIASYGWPAHNMAVGITSWQEQVPIPQNYTGDNSWAIPLNPVISDNPLDTSLRLRKGALAVAVNGIPIFNSLNNRGNDSYLLGELDNWGGHFGRGDDYHYHLPPTHLEELVGEGNPIAYALDGFPLYGYTNKTLDDALGLYDENGNYRYHASTDAPYFIAKMMGEVTIDPTSTAPEDQIIPQAFSSPVRPSDGFGPVDGAEVTAFSQTGDNAFSFEYTVSGTKYYINYSWDPTSCDYTYIHVDENGGTSNLPTNGAIADGSTENVETYTNRSFCIDLPYTGTTPTDDTSTVSQTTDTSSSTTSTNTSSGYTATSLNSNFSLSSIAIDANGAILESYKCEAKVNGVENSIPISWANVPEGTGSLAISIHANINATEINHYLILWDIDPSVTEIPYGGADDGDWFMGPNKDFAKISYSSPCSPSPGTNTYIMTIYALSATPSSLPTENSLEVSYPILLSAIESVTLIDSVQMTYISVTE